MAGQLAGAVLGTLSSELYGGLQTLARTSTHFKDLAEGIKSTLEYLLPLIKQIEDQNVELGLSNHYAEKLKVEIVEGLELVRNCSEVGPWNISKKLLYTNELRELDDSLKKWLHMLLLDGVRDAKETLQLVRAMRKMIMPAMFIVALGVLVLVCFIIRL